MSVYLATFASGAGARVRIRVGAVAGKSPLEENVEKSLFLVEALSRLSANLLSARWARWVCQKQKFKAISTI